MITLSGNDGNLVGLSTDTKPETAEVNTLFLEVDTGDFYYFGADEEWHKVGGDE